MTSARWAWVTGATGVWGRKTTLGLLRRGFSVVALSRREPTDLLAWAQAQGYALRWQALDLLAADGWPALDALPAPYALFHCAAAMDDDLEALFRVNVTQPIRLIEAVAARMSASGGGHIGVFLGQNGRIGLPGLGGFSATQGALWTWCESYARTLAKQKQGVSLTRTFPPRAASPLQAALASRLAKPVRLGKPVNADALIRDVLAGKSRAGRWPWLAGLLTMA